MSKNILLVLAFAVWSGTGAAEAGRIRNGSFEQAFELQDDGVIRWGEHGEAFGETGRVAEGDPGHPAKAKAGKRFIVIDTPPASWNGVYQEFDARAKQPFLWKASYQIVGDLPEGVATFLKVEFYTADDYIASLEGEFITADTKGRWVETSVKGTTPPGTKKVRFVIIAGENLDGAEVKNRIYWDDASAQ